MSDEPREPHGLFLPEEEGDDDYPSLEEVQFISVQRLSPQRENAGRAFSAAEIPDAEALRIKFGGGTYRVTARGSRKQVVNGGSREYTFGGLPPYPMDGSGPPLAPAAPAAPAPPLGTSSSDAKIERLTSLVERLMERMATPAPAANNGLGDLVAMMRDQNTAMTGMVRDLIASKASAASSTEPILTHEVFVAGQNHALETMSTLLDARRENAENSGGDESMVSTISAVVEGLKAMKDLRGPAKTAAAAATAATPAESGVRATGT